MSNLEKRVERLEGPDGDMPRLILVQSGSGFIQKGTNKSYTQAEAADLESKGLAVLVTFRVVYHEGVQNGHE